MGEIAEATIDGEFDYITGEYLGPGGGFPRTRAISRGKHKKYSSQLYGIIKYLYERSPSITEWQGTIHKYHKEQFNEACNDNDVVANKIQGDFGSFISWVNKTFPKK